MPVHGDHFDRRAARDFSRGAKLHVEQRENSAEQVQTVRAGENVKKAAAGIRRQKNSLGGELAPGENLSGDEKNAKKRGGGPPVAESFIVSRAESAMRAREGEAADDQYQSVEPQDARDLQRNPGAIGHVLAHDVGADERHEKHQNARKRYQHPGDVGALRNPGRTGRIAAVSPIAPADGETSAAGALVGMNQLNFFGDDCTWHCVSPKLARSVANPGGQPRTAALFYTRHL